MAQTDYLPEEIRINDQYQGDTFAGLEFVITRNGVAKTLLGSTITMTFLLGNRRTDNDQVLTLGDGLTITDAANATFDMDEIPLVDWAAGEYWFDMEIIYADGEIKTPVIGKWKIVQDKTNNS